MLLLMNPMGQREEMFPWDSSTPFTVSCVDVPALGSALTGQGGTGVEFKLTGAEGRQLPGLG